MPHRLFLRKEASMRARRLLSLLCLPLLLGATTAPPQRIVSLNLCADQLLIALADRGQVAALTLWARDPSLSFYAARARGFRVTRHTAEEVLALRPDLVVGAPLRMRPALTARGAALLDVPDGADFAGIAAAVRIVAAATGHRVRGERLIGAMAAELAAVGPPAGRGRTAAFYQRGGYLTGTGTLMDAAMARVGLINLARRLGASPLSQLPLEQLVLARPDFLVTDGTAETARDRGAALLRHPLLARSFPPARRLVVPRMLTVCGGPGYPRAVALLAAQLRAADNAR